MAYNNPKTIVWASIISAITVFPTLLLSGVALAYERYEVKFSCPSLSTGNYRVIHIRADSDLDAFNQAQQYINNQPRMKGVCTISEINRD